MASTPLDLRAAARAWARLAARLFPAWCFVCGAPLPARQLLGACAPCWAALVPIRAPACGGCGLPLPEEARAARPPARCARCVVLPPPFERAVAAVVYDATARRFLLRAKSGGRRELLGPIGGQLAAAVRVAGIARDVDVVIGVPSGPLARLRRGFDPGGELAAEVARASGLPHARRALSRRLVALSQSKGLPASQRRRAVERAFAARPLGRCRVLLVDDVMTSGATAAACAAALASAGATAVRLAVWARTPARSRF